MDTRKPSKVVTPVSEPRMGIAGGRPCVECGVIVHWRVEKFCLEQPKRFGGRIYCRSCQSSSGARTAAS